MIIISSYNYAKRQNGRKRWNVKVNWLLYFKLVCATTLSPTNLVSGKGDIKTQNIERINKN